MSGTWQEDATTEISCSTKRCIGKSLLIRSLKHKNDIVYLSWISRLHQTTFISLLFLPRTGTRSRRWWGISAQRWLRHTTRRQDEKEVSGSVDIMRQPLRPENILSDAPCTSTLTWSGPVSWNIHWNGGIVEYTKFSSLNTDTNWSMSRNCRVLLVSPRKRTSLNTMRAW